MMFNPRKHHKIGCGVECTVYNWGPGRVIKVFRTERNRNGAMRRQKQACKAGFGPKVFGSINISARRWSYVSEYAKPYPHRALSSNAAKSLSRKMKALGWIDWDLNPRNCGKIGNRVVLLDFGPMSTLPSLRNSAQRARSWVGYGADSDRLR